MNTGKGIVLKLISAVLFAVMSALVRFLGDGMMPDGDYAGGPMADVISNTSLLSADDRAAMANYIASLPPTVGPTKPPKKEKKD